MAVRLGRKARIRAIPERPPEVASSAVEVFPTSRMTEDTQEGPVVVTSTQGGPARGSVGQGEAELLAALRRGDEAAFAGFVSMYNGMLMRLAAMYVRDRSVAEDVVQETWIGFLESLDRFEGRASVKTWLFRILVNSAKKRLRRDRRTIPFSSLGPKIVEPAEQAVDPERFLGSDHPQWPNHWRSDPPDWEAMPESHVVSGETMGVVEGAIETLAPAQREVITLRDIEGWTSQEVCNALGITDTNQRVLLHRARSRVRRELEKYFDKEKIA